MMNSHLQLNIEFIIASVVILAVYLLPRFKYTKSQLILQTPSNYRQGLFALLASLIIIIYHAYLFSYFPSRFLHCNDQCSVSLTQGISFLLGYSHPNYEFTDYGHYSRLIFSGIMLFSLAVSFSFYIRHINENRHCREQILHLKRKSEVVLERYKNPSYDSRDELSSIYVDYDLKQLGLYKLELAIIEYRSDNSLTNLHKVIEEIEQLKNI